MSRIMNGAFVGLFVIVTTSCARLAAPVEQQGSCADVHGGQICTWSKSQGSALIEVGATVPIASIEGAPAEGPMAWPPVSSARLDVPESARSSSGLTEMTMFWEPMGHPPGPYLTPHFDFHFYLVPSAERDAIDCQNLAKPAAIPAGYSLPDVPLPPPMAQMTGVGTLVGLCVPKMGMHSLLTSEMESTQTFRGTMVVGYYGGKPIFVEPMVTKAMLMEKKSFELPIPTIPGVGAHPTKFRAEWDAAKAAYRFTFSGFAAATPAP